MNDEEYEEQAWESKDILFPIDDERTKSFCVLNSDERMQVIELGLIVREVGISQVKSLLQGKNKTEQNVLKKIHNKDVKANIIDHPKSYPNDEPQRRCPNINKAKKDLKYTTKVKLEKGLKDFLDWAKNNYKIY